MVQVGKLLRNGQSQTCLLYTSIGAGFSHKTLIKEFVELGAHVTLCDQKKSVEEFGDYAATIRELGIDLSLSLIHI